MGAQNPHSFIRYPNSQIDLDAILGPLNGRLGHVHLATVVTVAAALKTVDVAAAALRQQLV